MPHDELVRMRDSSADPAFQDKVSVAEHQAFAREYATESPVRALGLLAAIPGYQVAKGFGAMQSRTGTRVAGPQMAAGFRGLGEGWMQALRNAIPDLVPTAQAAETLAVEQPRVIHGQAFFNNPVGASPIDRRGPWFGVPRASDHASSAVVPAPQAAPVSVPKSFESEYERELRVIRGNTGGVVPHQGLGAKQR